MAINLRRNKLIFGIIVDRQMRSRKRWAYVAISKIYEKKKVSKKLNY